MKTYDKYKPSGIEWVGDIPEHWKVVPLTKYLDSVIDYRGRTPTKVEEGIFLITARNIKNGVVNYEISKEYILKEEFEKTMSRGALEIGDVLFTTEAPLGEVANVDKIDVAVAQRVIKFRANKNLLDNYFLKEWIKSEKFQQDLLSFATGSTAVGIKGSKLFHLKLVLPTLQEQLAIVQYLNEKTAEIDKLIANKKRLIKLLKEERTAIINQAVTRGINPNAKLKFSGIDWLGDIPEHWEVKKLKFLGKCQNGISEGSDYFGSGYPFVSYGDVYKNYVLPFNVEGLANSSNRDRKHYSVKEGDIFFTRTSETIEEIGIASTCLKTIENATFSGFLIRFRPDKDIFDKHFAKYYFRSQIQRVFFVREMNLVTRASLSQELLKRLPVLLPGIKQQKEIADFLNKKTSEIDSTISKIEKEINLIKEYRTALISEVVTGKIKVTQ